MMLLSSDTSGIVVSTEEGVKTLKPDEKVTFGIYVYPDDNREEYIEHEFTRKELLDMATGVAR